MSSFHLRHVYQFLFFNLYNYFDPLPKQAIITLIKSIKPGKHHADSASPAVIRLGKRKSIQDRICANDTSAAVKVETWKRHFASSVPPIHVLRVDLFSQFLFINNFQLQYIIIKQQIDLEYSKIQTKDSDETSISQVWSLQAYYALYKNNKINTNGWCCVYIYIITEASRCDDSNKKSLRWTTVSIRNNASTPSWLGCTCYKTT